MQVSIYKEDLSGVIWGFLVLHEAHQARWVLSSFPFPHVLNSNEVSAYREWLCRLHYVAC